MSATADAPQPVLVYRRIDHNRRKTLVLIAFSVLTLLPFVLGVSFMLASGVTWWVRSETRHTRSAVRADLRLLRRLEQSETRSALNEYLERDLEVKRPRLAQLEAGDREMALQFVPVFGVAIIAALGILCWGIASSPTSKLLDQAGARPAAGDEMEAVRLLENLAIGAGLPPPKLYVIESSIPNAFAAGMDPRHAVVAVTRGALTLFDRRELEGVLAHELSHIGNHDIRLNTIVASMALFLRIPYLMFRRGMQDQSYHRRRVRNRLGLLELALSPVGLYIFFVGPILASVLRAAVSREREFLADADVALLTRYPEGLMRALAKIGGAGSTVGNANPAFSHFYFADPVKSSSWFSGNLMATHPPIAERVERLASLQGAAGIASLEQAVKLGRQYTADHPLITIETAVTLGAHDELAALNQGNLMGRVYRLLTESSVPVYDTPSTSSQVLARVQPGALLVVFDDPGSMRQVNTAEQTFGYMERTVTLAPVNNMIPAEVYDPRLRAAAEAALPSVSAALAGAAAAAPVMGGLTRSQLYIVLGFGGAVFAGMLTLLVVFGK